MKLGTYASGDIKKLHVELRVDAANLDYWAMQKPSISEVQWNFTAVKEESPDGPNTGIGLRLGRYILLMLLSIAIAVFWGYQRKLKKQLLQLTNKIQ